MLLLKGTEDEINLKLYTNFTARIAIVSYKLGFRITDVQLDNATLSHDWNCKNPFYLKELCGIKPKESKLVKNKSWPWVVAIYQYRLVETKSKYKAGGSILSTKYILTSGNGLFYEGRFLLSEELKVHVSRTDLNPRENSQAFKIYKVNFL